MKAMKIKSEFKLRKVAGEYVAMASGAESRRINGTIMLNESGALLWKTAVNECTRDDLIEALKKEYGIDDIKAASGVDKFISTLAENKIFE